MLLGQVVVEGVQILKPKTSQDVTKSGIVVNGFEETSENPGVDLEAQLVTSDGGCGDEVGKWAVEKIKFSVKRPVEELNSLYSVRTTKLSRLSLYFLFSLTMHFR